MKQNTQDAPHAPNKRDMAMSVALALLAVSATVLSIGNDILHRRLARLRHDSALLAQERVVRTETRELAAEFFTIDDTKRRRFTLTATAYCPSCGSPDGRPQPTAQGGVVRPGHTVAVSRDLKRLLGRTVFIKGLGVRVVEDLMHPRFTDRLDLCLPSREQALEFGVKRLEMVVLD